MQSRNSKILFFLIIAMIICGSFLLWSGLSNTALPGVPINIVSTATESTKSALPVAENSVKGISGERALVLNVIDGDTIEISLNGLEEKVRLVGIDTPETKDPRRPVGCFGKEASSETKSLLQDKIVILQQDVTDKDKFGRLLRYVYLPMEDKQLLFVNDYLVRTGFAKVYRYPPDVKFNEQFMQAQQEAKNNKKGMWGKC